MDGLKEARWLGSSLDDLKAMPEQVVSEFGHGLFLAQTGLHPSGAKPLKGWLGAVELIERYDGETYRAVYTVQFRDLIYVLHCFQKKSPRGSELSRPDKNTIEARLKSARLDAQGENDVR